MEIPEVPGTTDCLVDGCDRVGRVGGYCAAHHRRIMRHGDPGDAYIPTVMSNQGKTCSSDGCESAAITKGMCNLHYRRTRAKDKPRKRRTVMVTDPNSPHDRSHIYKSGATCAGPECGRLAVKLALCETHYAQDRNGWPLSPIRKYRSSTRGMSVPERMAHYTGKPESSGCMLWLGSTDPNGYGTVSDCGKKRGAHRVAWSLANDQEIPKGMQIHHACAVPLCVNPDHLHLITQRENKAEMLERNYYLARIAELESEVRNAKSA